MRKLAIAAALASALSFGGCATVPGGVGGGTDTISQVQQIAATVCFFVPTAATIAGILAAGNPALQSASAIATAICNAITAPKMSSRRGAAAPRVGRVAVYGTYLR